MKFAEKQLKEKQPRDHYREFFELCVFFGWYSRRRNIFQVSRTNASCKMDGQSNILFESVDVLWTIQIVKKESNGSEKILVFIVKFYLKAWTTATDGV